METVIVQVNNRKAYKLLENLEDLQIIKIRNQATKSVNSNRIKRLKEIQSITKNIQIDLSNFHFNRDAANSYDE
jgi:hypothetical protein